MTDEPFYRITHNEQDVRREPMEKLEEVTIEVETGSITLKREPEYILITTYDIIDGKGVVCVELASVPKLIEALQKMKV